MCSAGLRTYLEVGGICIADDRYLRDGGDTGDAGPRAYIWQLSRPFPLGDHSVSV